MVYLIVGIILAAVIYNKKKCVNFSPDAATLYKVNSLYFDLWNVIATS